MRVDVSPRGETRDALAQDLVSLFAALGYHLILVPNQPALTPLLFETIKPDGILLSGGNDLNPELYGGNPARSQNVSRERDQTEKMLLELAVKNQTPVLGICRGLQMINVFFGGHILQDISAEIPDPLDHTAALHPLQWVSNEFSKAFKQFNSPIVNSFHRQGLTRNEISDELEILAISSDGIVEAAKHKKWNILGIMWHPERNGSDSRLDQALIRHIFVFEGYS